jgi:hypothetical protein
LSFVSGAKLSFAALWSIGLGKAKPAEGDRRGDKLDDVVTV